MDAGDDIRERMWSDVADLTRLLDEARRVLEATRAQAQSLRQRADRDGHAAGVAKAQAEAVRHVLEAHQAARELVGASKSRIVSLATSVIARIAPTLNTPDVVATLASEVMPTVRGERHVSIHVGSGAAEATREMLERWQDAHPETGAIQVLTEPRLAPFCCVVESELGRVELNLDAQSLGAQSLGAHREDPAPAHNGADTVFWLPRDGD